MTSPPPDFAIGPAATGTAGWLPTVVLRHAWGLNSHHDWLLADPAAPQGKLWAGRVDPPPRTWRGVGWWLIEQLPPHRRVYLRYQGPIGPPAEQPAAGGRGRVWRVDEGHYRPLLWGEHRRVLEIVLNHFTGRVELCRLDPGRWRAAVLM